MKFQIKSRRNPFSGNYRVYYSLNSGKEQSQLRMVIVMTKTDPSISSYKRKYILSQLRYVIGE
jgi:hypothetical protein